MTERWQFPLGLYGAGMAQFVLDEVELGRRAAQQLDDPEQWWWAFDGGIDYDRAP